MDYWPSVANAGIEKRHRGADLGPAGRPNPYPPVGCRTILQPVFFPRDAWVLVPSDWSPSIVQGKTYDLAHGGGRRMWEACCDHAQTLAAAAIGCQATPTFTH